MSDKTKISDRKVEHIKIVNEVHQVDREQNYFSRIKLIHRALPEIDFKDIDLSLNFLGRKLSAPILISSMTGGDSELLKTINKNLATAAQATGVAMAVGSQRIMLEKTAAEQSFMLREFAPDIPLIANLGAVQLNYGCDLISCQKVINTLDADGLYLHLNPLQEVVQPEGDTDFKGLASKISAIAQAINIPVILKEVGAGLSPLDIKLMHELGIRYFDVAGSGGTSWSRIEHFRQEEETNSLGVTFQDWGIPTPIALEYAQNLQLDMSLIASGGIRNGQDIAKSIILGAEVAGLAKPFLKAAGVSSDAVIEVINALKQELKLTMFLLGCKDISDLKNNKSLILN